MIGNNREKQIRLLFRISLLTSMEREIYPLEVEKPSSFIKIPMKFALFVTKGFCCFGEAGFSRRDISELRRSWKTN